MAGSTADPMPVGGQVDRALIARIAAAERWARTPDRVAATEPARRGLRARFEREADPEGALDVAERNRRADALFTPTCCGWPAHPRRRGATASTDPGATRYGALSLGVLSAHREGQRPACPDPPSGGSHLARPP